MSQDQANDLISNQEVADRISALGFWFVDIPRTSSTSIKLLLSKKFGPLFGKLGNQQGVQQGLVLDHMPARVLKQRLGDGLWDSLFSFAMVRNPWERTLSMYLFRRQIEQNINVEFDEYIARLAASRRRADLLFQFHGHSASCCDLVCDEQGNQLVSQVFRYEDRDTAMSELAEKLEMPELHDNGEKLSKTLHGHYSQYYTAETRRLVSEVYADDIRRFGYRFIQA